MAKLIFISPYLKGGTNSARLANHVRYISTRDGVQTLNDGAKNLPPTKKQEEYIQKLTKKFSEAKLLPEYDEYVSAPSRYSAYANQNAFGHVPGLKGLKVVDTCGAGDIFGGSAVWGVLNTGKAPDKLDTSELKRIVSFACAAAGLSTERSGGISSILSPYEVERIAFREMRPIC